MCCTVMVLENWCWWPWGHWDLWRAVTHKAIFSGFSVIRVLYSFNSPVLPMPWWQWFYIQLEQWCWALSWHPLAQGRNLWDRWGSLLAPSLHITSTCYHGSVKTCPGCPVTTSAVPCAAIWPLMTFSHFLCKISDFTGAQMTMPRLSTARQHTQTIWVTVVTWELVTDTKSQHWYPTRYLTIHPCTWQTHMMPVIIHTCTW